MTSIADAVPLKATNDKLYVLVYGFPGAGKGVRLDCPVLTLEGWRPIGKLQLGDEIIGADGLPHPVYGIYDRGLQNIYRVEFSDGTWVDTDAEHLWRVTTHKGKYLIQSTVELAASAELSPKTATRSRLRIPLADPIQHPEASLPIAPYMLGALIADGYLAGNQIQWAKNSQAVADEVAANGHYEVVEKTSRSSTARQWGFSPNIELRHALGGLGLYGLKSRDKFIPAEYLYGSETQRRELLAGLMDGDGSISAHKGQPRYSSMSRRLCSDVAELVRSLGGLANEPKKQSDGTWRTSFMVPDCPFRAADEVGKWRYPETRFSRRIISIKSVGEAETRCISVASPDGLFVVKDHIVTHNTSKAGTIADIPAVERVLVVDVPGEQGTESLLGRDGVFDVVRISHPKDVSTIHRELLKGEHPYDAVILDSVSAYERLLVRHLQGQSGEAQYDIEQNADPKAKPETNFKMWMKAKDRMVDLLVWWGNLASVHQKKPIHVVFTCQARFESRDDQAITNVALPDVRPATITTVLGCPDQIVYCAIEEKPSKSVDAPKEVQHVVYLKPNPASYPKTHLPEKLMDGIPLKLPGSKFSLAKYLEILGMSDSGGEGER